MTKANTTHSKLPWILTEPDSDDPETMQTCMGVFSNGYICPVVIKEDAQLIITAVNNHAKLVELLNHIYDRLEGHEDIVNGENGKQLPNTAMSIRMDIESVLNTLTDTIKEKK